MTRGSTRILLVCTANQCRSPLAAAIARRDAEDRLVRFDSAGLIEGGHRMPATGVRVAAKLGLDLSDHVSQQIDMEAAHDYDLILTMTREQAREILIVAPDLWPRVFTLKQFSRWLGDHPAEDVDNLRAWLNATARERVTADLVGSASEDDVRDPLRSRAKVWRWVASELEHHLRVVVTGLGLQRISD